MWLQEEQDDEYGHEKWEGKQKGNRHPTKIVNVVHRGFRDWDTLFFM
jgi:hypothetical protein